MALTAQADGPAWLKCPGGHVVVEDADKLAAAGRVRGYRDALAELERSGAGEEALACVEDRLSTAMSSAGRLREAIEWLQHAAKRQLDLEPRETTAAVTNRLANLHLQVRDFDAAERWAREALRVAKAVYPPNHPGELSALNTIATLHVCRHDYARAEPIYRSVLYHLERAYGPRHAAVGSAADNLAETVMAQGRHADAARLYEKAIRAYTLATGLASQGLLSAQSGLMIAYARSGHRDLAERFAVETLAAAERQLAGNDPALGLVLQRVALVRSLAGEYASARISCLRALRIVEVACPRDSPQVIALLETFASILRSAKDRKAARRVESRLRSLHHAIQPSAPGRKVGDGSEVEAKRPEPPSQAR